MADTLAGHIADAGSAIPYPEDDGALWDRVKLGPNVLPGSWIVRGGVKRRVDVKTTRGQDGARFRDQGYKPGVLTLTGEMVGADAWNEMVSISKRLTPRSRGIAMEPLACEHPTFTYLGVTNVLVLEVMAPVVNGGKISCVIRVQEWMKKPKKKPKPKDIPDESTAYASGRIQREARDKVWAIPPSQEFDQLNLDAVFEKQFGLKPYDGGGTDPKPQRSWADLGLK